MSTEETIIKGKLKLTASSHFIDQLQNRFGIEVNVKDSFLRAKQANNQNAIKFGKTIADRVYAKAQYEPNQKLYINTYYDQVFVVDFSTNMIVTTYKLSEAKSKYSL